MICEKCEGRGFTEQEHGLVMVLCDCEKGKAKRAEITGEMDDSSSGTERDNQPSGKSNTSKPKRKRKQKKSKVAGKGTR